MFFKSFIVKSAFALFGLILIFLFFSYSGEIEKKKNSSAALVGASHVGRKRA